MSDFTYVLAVDYSEYRLVTKAGGRWDEYWQVCTYTGKALPASLAGYDIKPFSYEAYAERELNQGRPRPGAGVSDSAQSDSGTLRPGDFEKSDSGTLRPSDFERSDLGTLRPGDLERSDLGTLRPSDRHTLRPHQEAAREAALKAYHAKLPGFLMADEVGLGKTDAAWESVLRLPGKKVLILCPLGVIPVWRETLLRQGTGDKDVIVLNYDRLKKLLRVEDRSKVKSLKGVAKFGQAQEFDLIICDESHRLKNMSSARFKLAQQIGKKARFQLWLSATAGQNPLELGYLAGLLAARTGDSVKELNKDFEAWCLKQGLGVARGKFGKWDYTESKESCDKIHRLLYHEQNGIVAAIRRTPKDISGWPEIQRIPLAVELTPAQRELYALEWGQFLATLRGEAQKLGKGRALRSPNGLAAITRLRQKASRLRVDATTEQVLELLDNGRQVAVSCQFLRNVEEIEEALLKQDVDCVTFTGKMSAEEREANRVAYQKGEVRVILFTCMEGISLHQGEYPGKASQRPRAQIDHDLRWSAIEMNQIDGRSHRNGQFAPVYWSYSKDTIEQRVAEVMLTKLDSMQALHGEASPPEIELFLQSLL